MADKILFLDIDGVVNCASTKQRHGGFIGIDPVMAERVRGIITATGCKVVLSSTWRLTEGSRAEVRKRVCDFIGCTPRLPNAIRGEEIKTWLAAFPEVERYAILDDDGDFYGDQPLFQTSWQKGITPEIAGNVVEHLMVAANPHAR